MRLASSLPPAGPSATGCVLIQVAAREPPEVLQLAHRPGSGLVVTGAGAIETVQAMRRQGWTRPMLADRRRYAGTARIQGTASFTRSWLARQRDAGIAPVLTDSGYIGEGDLLALRRVLCQAAEAGEDVTAVLPLHGRWLLDDRALLISEVASHGVPVALVLEQHGEPATTADTAAGLIDVLRNAPSAALLGAGIAGLAALAFGANWAAVGVRGSLRSFPPVTEDGTRPRKRRRWRPAPHEIVAAPVLSFGTVDAVARAASTGHPAWLCRCGSCGGRSPGWLATASALEADAHTIDVLLSHADRLRRREPGPAREQDWRTQCRKAVRNYGELGLAALGWPPPAIMAAWVRESPLRSAG